MNVQSTKNEPDPNFSAFEMFPIDRRKVRRIYYRFVFDLISSPDLNSILQIYFILDFCFSYFSLYIYVDYRLFR